MTIYRIPTFSYNEPVTSIDAFPHKNLIRYQEVYMKKKLVSCFLVMAMASFHTGWLRGKEYEQFRSFFRSGPGGSPGIYRISHKYGTTAYLMDKSD